MFHAFASMCCCSASADSLLLNPYEDVVLPQITALFTFGSGSGGSAGDL